MVHKIIHRVTINNLQAHKEHLLLIQIPLFVIQQ